MPAAIKNLPLVNPSPPRAALDTVETNNPSDCLETHDSISRENIFRRQHPQIKIHHHETI